MSSLRSRSIINEIRCAGYATYSINTIRLSEDLWRSVSDVSDVQVFCWGSDWVVARTFGSKPSQFPETLMENLPNDSKRASRRKTPCIILMVWFNKNGHSPTSMDILQAFFFWNLGSRNLQQKALRQFLAACTKVIQTKIPLELLGGLQTARNSKDAPHLSHVGHGSTKTWVHWRSFLHLEDSYCYCWQRKCYHRLGYMKPATKLVSYNSTFVAFIQFATNQTRLSNQISWICVYILYIQYLSRYLCVWIWMWKTINLTYTCMCTSTYMPVFGPHNLDIFDATGRPCGLCQKQRHRLSACLHHLFFGVKQNRTKGTSMICDLCKTKMYEKKKKLHHFFLVLQQTWRFRKSVKSCIIWCQVTAAALRLWKSKQSGVSAWYEIRCCWRAFPLLFCGKKTHWNCKTMVVWNLKLVEFWSFQKSMAFDFKKVFPRFVLTAPVGGSPGTKGDGCPQQS